MPRDIEDLVPADERWADIPGYEGFYQVSDHGRVRSLARPVKTKAGWQRTTVPKVIGQCRDDKGYSFVRLHKDSHKRTLKVHRFVAACFVANPDNLPQVNHEDGVKTNNHYSNLEWCTGSQNMQHAYDTGLVVQNHGEDSHLAIISEDTALQILGIATAKNRPPQREIAEMFGISRRQVSAIKTGQNWKHLCRAA